MPDRLCLNFEDPCCCNVYLTRTVIDCTCVLFCFVLLCFVCLLVCSFCFVSFETRCRFSGNSYKAAKPCREVMFYGIFKPRPMMYKENKPIVCKILSGISWCVMYHKLSVSKLTCNLKKCHFTKKLRIHL